MIRNTTGERIINLDGPDGNAYVLLGLAHSFAKQLRWSAEEIKELQEAMMAGDYVDLVCIFHNHFGSIVTLETNQEDLLKRLRENEAKLSRKIKASKG